MKVWIVPTIALLLVGGAGFGIGWAVNEWQGDDGASVIEQESPTPIQTGPTQAETEAELQREEDRLCLEAQGVAAIAREARQAAVRTKAQEIQEELGWSAARANLSAGVLVGGGVPQEVQSAIDRYC